MSLSLDRIHRLAVRTIAKCLPRGRRPRHYQVQTAKLDAIVYDCETGYGRASIVLAVDTHTRMVIGVKAVTHTPFSSGGVRALPNPPPANS